MVFYNSLYFVISYFTISSLFIRNWFIYIYYIYYSYLYLNLHFLLSQNKFVKYLKYNYCIVFSRTFQLINVALKALQKVLSGVTMHDNVVEPEFAVMLLKVSIIKSLLISDQ